MPKKMRFTRREDSLYNSLRRLKLLRKEPGQSWTRIEEIVDGYPTLTGFRPITAIAQRLLEGFETHSR